MAGSNWQFWIDRGGTFTDIMALSPDGFVTNQKLLSENPRFYPDAAIEGIRRTLNRFNETIATAEIASVKMGTTVATNALLERRGEPTILAITKGFGDALRIAYQNRPDIFALEIKLPQPLYQNVIEINERVDVHGNILQELDLTQAEKDLTTVYQQGIRSIAIVLMHSYAYKDHEAALAKLAKKIGFTQISVSHRVIPLMKIISRGDTTVADAYLTPKLNYYVSQVEKCLKQVPLYFMQSNGGLAQAHAFHGKDSLLSGPAGGVIGAIKTAADADLNKIISFDMGGTSTDVAHYSGVLERRELTLLDGVRIRSPMLDINTVAAGGGSILHFKQGRFQVGPDSAAADPGPACYRKNGPLTVTDCNVILGRIISDYFPKTFGEQANQSLDKAIVEEKFLQLREEINKATNDERNQYQIAYEYLQIAVLNMANAIKKISIERGHDVTQYTLCCFGGAGGQHACMVADVLNIKTIYIHRYAGVLSAYGLGLADIRVVKEQAFEKELTKHAMLKILTLFDDLARQCESELHAQGIAHKEIICFKSVKLRYRGTDTTITLPYAKFENLRETFLQQFEETYGYLMKERTITIESLAVEGVVKEQSEIKTEISKREKSITATEHIKMYDNNQFIKTALYRYEQLKVGDTVAGPAIIVHEHSTTVLLSDWQLDIDNHGDLLLTRIKKSSKQQESPIARDPFMLEVFNNLFMSIAELMGTALEQTAYSVNIKERLDYSCALFDSKGHLVANAPHIPVHLGSMSESVQVIINKRKSTMKSGDVYMLNDPYHGGTHLPDITLITPVFIDERKTPQFYVACRAHQADIGGITPGSIPADSKTIIEEGVLIDDFLLVDQGELQLKSLTILLSTAKYPVRNLSQNIADLKAQIAANQRGVLELKKVIEQYGLTMITNYMQYIQDNAAECVRDVITRLQDGKFSYAMDNGATIVVKITVDKKNRCATIDFTGTSDQQNNNFNAPRAVCYAAVIYVFRTLVGEHIPLNQGCLLPLNIIIPKGSLLDPHYPAAIVAGNVETSQCIVDTLFGALNIMAAAQGTMNNLTFGNQDYQYYETICGGAGAGNGFNGASAVHTHMTNSLITDPEILEYRFPIVLHEFSIRHNSGGKGTWSGGNGVIRNIEFLQTMQVAIVSNRRRIPPYGMAGGAAGQCGENWLIRHNKTEKLPSTVTFNVNQGDHCVIKTPGGGGYGGK